MPRYYYYIIITHICYKIYLRMKFSINRKYNIDIIIYYCTYSVYLFTMIIYIYIILKYKVLDSHIKRVYKSLCKFIGNKVKDI